MVSPLLNMMRSTDRRNNNDNNNKPSPVGMTVVSPAESVSPLDTRMTPTRRMLFQRKRLSSAQARSVATEVSDVDVVEGRDDDPDNRINDELYHLRSANKKKDGQLKLLHERFNHIQNGLGTIDEERTLLIEKAKKLEKEKKLIQKQLQLREREILALVKRCASQEEKMRESSKLRSENRELQDQLDGVKRRLRGVEEGHDDLYSLKKKLQESELDREHLQDKLAKVQREHDAIADTLQECLGKIRQLTEEKLQIEEGRRRERKRAEIELEKQRLEHVNESNNLKEDIQLQQARISQMEKILQQNMYSNTALRREKAILLSNGNKGAIHEEVVQEYERQLSELRQQIDETAREKQMQYEEELSKLRKLKQVDETTEQGRLQDIEEEINFMREKLNEKDCVIEGLESEFSEQMSELMSKQSSLDEAEEEKKHLQEKVMSLNNLEIEHAALLDFVQILDSNLAELTTENAHLTLEKDSLHEEAEELRKKAETLQRQLRSIQENKNARESDFRDLLEAEKEELRTELEISLRKTREEVAALHTELESRSEWIIKLENELQDAHRKIIEKDHEIGRITSEMEVIRSTLSSSLRTARIEVAHLEAEVYARDQSLAALEGRLETAKETAEIEKQYLTTGKGSRSMKASSGWTPEHVEEIISVDDYRDPDQPRYLSDVCSSSEVRDASFQENDMSLLSLQVRAMGIDQSEKDRMELEQRIEEVQTEVLLLQQEIESLTEARSDLESELNASRSLINDRDEQIVSLQHALLGRKKRENELERQLDALKRELKSREITDESTSGIQEGGGKGHKSQCSTSEGSPSKSGFWSLDVDTKVVVDSPKVRKLRSDWEETQKLLSESEQRVAELEQNYEKARRDREESGALLDEAKNRITDLEAQISGNKKTEQMLLLENKLNEATRTLYEDEMKAYAMENEHSASRQLQTERKTYNREASSRIAVLEKRIAETNNKSIDLEVRVKESKQAIEGRDTEIALLRDEILKGEEVRNDLHLQLGKKGEQVTNLESSLASRDKHLLDLQREMESTTIRLSEKECRIGDLEILVQKNQSLLGELETALSDANEKIMTFEQEIASHKEKTATLEQQLKDALHTATQSETHFNEMDSKVTELYSECTRLQAEVAASEKTRSELEDQLTCAIDDTLKLEEKIDSILSSQADLDNQLQKARATHENERQAWQTNEAALSKEKQSLTEELSSVHADIIEKEAKIQTLQGLLKENEAMYENLERTLDEAHKTVQASNSQKESLENKCEELEKEIQETRDTLNEKYDNLEKEHEAVSLTMAQREILLSTLKESEKERNERNLILESQLSDAKDEIACLEREIEVRGKTIECLEREIEDLSGGEVELAFVESEKHRINLEGELASAQRKFQDLAKCMEDREKRLLEVDHELETAHKNVEAERQSLDSVEQKCYELQVKVKSLDEMLGTREESLMKVDHELDEVKHECSKKDETIQELMSTTVCLEKALKIAQDEISKQRDIMVSLKQSADEYKSGMERSVGDSAKKAERLEILAQDLESEKVARKILESDIVLLKENLHVLEISKEVTATELHEKTALASTLEKELSDTRNTLEELNRSSGEVTAKLGAQLLKVTTDLALKDDEIRELRLVELKDAEEIIASLTDEINALKEEALHKNLERTAEKGNLTHEINSLRSTLAALSSETEQDRENHRKQATSMISSIEMFQSKKKELEKRIKEQDSKLYQYERSIQALNERLSESEQREEEIRYDRDQLFKREEEAREEVENLKTELELSVLREQEMTEMKLRNKDAIHREEMEQALLELQTTLEKLRDSETNLAERSNLLGEMVDHNRDLESKFEKEQSDLRNMESKFAQGRVDLEETRRDLKKVLDERRRKENVLEAKLAEEKEQKDFAEKSLKLLKAKYDEAVKTKKNVAELEKQNEELRDKVRRQEAFLQRKLQKEKEQRDRLTPTKSVISQSDCFTPTKSLQSVPPSASKSVIQTPTQRAVNTRLPQSASSATRPPQSSLQVPKTVRASGIPKASTSGSAGTSTTRYLTPAKQGKSSTGNGGGNNNKNNASSSDRSMTSELSSLLRTPTPSKGDRVHRSKSEIPDWELELG